MQQFVLLGGNCAVFRQHEKPMEREKYAHIRVSYSFDFFPCSTFDSSYVVTCFTVAEWMKKKNVNTDHQNFSPFDSLCTPSAYSVATIFSPFQHKITRHSSLLKVVTNVIEGAPEVSPSCTLHFVFCWPFSGFWSSSMVKVLVEAGVVAEVATEVRVAFERCMFFPLLLNVTFAFIDCRWHTSRNWLSRSTLPASRNYCWQCDWWPSGSRADCLADCLLLLPVS